MRRLVIVGLVFTVALFAATACGGGDTEEPAAPAAGPAEEQPAAVAPTEQPTEEPTEEMAEVGTQENPVPLGSPMAIEPWEVTVTDVDTDAADTVAAENQFNDPPAEGRSFVMIGLSATRTGEESGSFWGEMSYKVLGSGGNTYSDRCGVIPNDLSDAGETFKGATVTGNLCFSVDTAQLDGAQLIVEQAFSFGDGGRQFFALQ